MLVIGIVTLGSTGLYFKKTYHPGPVSAGGSPGRVLGGYESHAAFEEECLHCHAPIHCLSANRCQTCHMDIAQERAGSEGLHGLMPGTGKCQTCHTEHKGRDADITSFALVNIDHERLTGFSLSQHEEADGTRWPCDTCHREGQFVAAMVDCVGCHSKGAERRAFMRNHVATFGDGCTACHDGRDTMSSGGHGEIYFPDGPHSDLTCDACHAERPSPGASATCTACHQEPAAHAGKFGQDCSRCHTTAVWSPAEIRRHAFRLDHGGTETLECRSCHEDRYTAYTCNGCHEAELLPAAHPAETNPAGCATCHPTGQKGEGEQHRTRRAEEDGVPGQAEPAGDGSGPGSGAREGGGEDGNRQDRNPSGDPGQIDDEDRHSEAQNE